MTTAIDGIARTRLYRDGTVVLEGFPVADVSEHLAAEGCCVWVDLCAPTEADLEVIAEELGLHELAVQDALGSRQRPKLDRYATHEFLNMYAVTFDHDTGEIQRGRRLIAAPRGAAPRAR